MILLDMDGVITDLVGRVKERLGEPPYENTWNIHEWYDMEFNDFWDAVADDDFWNNLKGFEGWRDFYNELCRRDTVILCSTPSPSPYSASGKLKWIYDNLGKDFKNYVLTPQKHLLDGLLIDDYDGNVEQFRKWGGKAILVPRPYNKNRDINNSYKYVLDELK